MTAPAVADVAAAGSAESEPVAMAMRSGLVHSVRERDGLTFHVFRAAPSTMAACSRWLLDDLYVLSPDEVPYSRRCQRPACRTRWEAALKPKPPTANSLTVSGSEK